MNIENLLKKTLDGQQLTDDEAKLFTNVSNDETILDAAKHLRDRGFSNLITYSRKVFIPLTHLCRDVCHYCTFAKSPQHVDAAYMSIEQVLNVAKQGQQLNCKEALLTLGEKPEQRYTEARSALQNLGCETTLEYVARAAKAILDETSLLPHINGGCMSKEEINILRPVSASMGIMLESASPRLCEIGMPHYGSPDKHPEARLKTIELTGQMQVPLTSGILIGIGETRLERIESLLALRTLHERYGHIQEIIVQNFKAKPKTKMAHANEPDVSDLLWTVAVARLIFGPAMSIQAPPNLSPGVLPQIIHAGINDWGGVSPLTPDFVNPEAPWPELAVLEQETLKAGKYLHERLTVYPSYIRHYQVWLDEGMHKRILKLVDGSGLPMEDTWSTGNFEDLPEPEIFRIKNGPKFSPVDRIKRITDMAMNGDRIDETGIMNLFNARDDDFAYVCRQADTLRKKTCGDDVTYVVNRNINYTNICYFKCQFCAFSKGKLSENLRGTPYDLSEGEIIRRSQEAWQRGATEVCLQGGIHPDYTGENYLNICKRIKENIPEMHIHAFSPLEIWQGAATLGISLKAFLQQLKDAGLATLPGTAAEILDDEVRAVICPDKINTAQWLEVMKTAHELGIKTTATIMFGHVDGYQHWARHLVRVRDLQKKTGGFTEFVPLPFVGSEAPIFLKGRSRIGPTFRESVLMHAVARLVLNPHITNIQASWVKMGKHGALACLNSGANDLGGTLMNESITRAAGGTNGQELSPTKMEELIVSIDRVPTQRTTLYTEPDPVQKEKSFHASELTELVNTSISKYRRPSKKNSSGLILNEKIA